MPLRESDTVHAAEIRANREKESESIETLEILFKKLEDYYKKLKNLYGRSDQSDNEERTQFYDFSRDFDEELTRLYGVGFPEQTIASMFSEDDIFVDSDSNVEKGFGSAAWRIKDSELNKDNDIEPGDFIVAVENYLRKLSQYVSSRKASVNRLNTSERTAEGSGTKQAAKDVVARVADATQPE